MSEQEPREPETREAGAGLGRLRVLGIALFAAAILLWVATLAVPFFPLSTASKVWTASVFLIVAEVAFWISAVVLGSEVYRRYRGFLDPRRLFGKGAGLNEFEIIGRISALLPPAPPEVLVPVGDDCAVLRIGGGTWVAASDMLVSGHHFKGWATPEDVGYKAVAVNVSDVAAMGGTPRFVLVSGGAPDPATTLRCFEGVVEACEGFGVYPIGGDTTRSDALTLDVSILGELAARPVLRSGASPGELLAVTGELGASAAGLLTLENGTTGPERLVRRHLRPEPRVEVGRVAASLGASAMIDLSDGLASDVRRLCEASGVGCRVDLGLLPVADDTRELATSFGRDPEVLAATGGEDYELLISAPEPVVEALAGSVEIPVTVVGEITTEGVVFRRGDEPVEDLSGWDHFV